MTASGGFRGVLGGAIAPPPGNLKEYKKIRYIDIKMH